MTNGGRFETHVRHASFCARASNEVDQLDLDARRPQPIEPASCSGADRGSDDDPRDAGRRGPRRRKAAVCPWWEHGSSVTYSVAPRARLAGRLERDDLGVRPALPLVPALADDLAVAHDDRADDRVRMRRSAPSLGELERPLQHQEIAWTRPR